MKTGNTHWVDHTVAHFQHIARQNRFAENSQIPHDTQRCAVCHPERTDMSPFALYLHVVTQSIKVRRPRLDEELLAQMNEDLALMGSSRKVSMDQLLDGEEEALSIWREWIRDALSTGLALLAVHSETSLEFDLDEQEDEGHGDLIRRSIGEIMDHQRANRIT